MCVRSASRITQTAATVAELMGFSMPEKADHANSIITGIAAGEKIQRALLYNPDAVALWLYQKYTDLFLPVIRNSHITLPVQTVMPSVTPVCFGSMYTGLQPQEHGIMKYEKPVLRVPTLFDAAIAKGLRPIIISTAGDSISKIFLEREMDYIICQTPDECNQQALEIIRRNQHHIVVIYNGNYDYTMHRFGPESEAALQQLAHNATAFEILSSAAKEAWAGIPSMAAFLPDHGCHNIDGDLGSHGLDMDEDMNIVHFYEFW